MSFSAKNGHISHLRLKTEQELCKKLNSRNIVGGDYETFASCLSFRSDDLALIDQVRNPTKEILRRWKHKPGATIAKLIKVFVEMGRLDCVEIVKEDPLFDGLIDVKDTIQKYVDVSHEKEEKSKEFMVTRKRYGGPGTGLPLLAPRIGLPLLDAAKLSREWRSLKELKESTYNKLCDELNGTLYQPNPPSTFSLLAEEMGYNMGKTREFKNSTNPTDALLQDWEKRPGNGVNELIKLLKKVERKALAEMLEKEVEEIPERENLDVKPRLTQLEKKDQKRKEKEKERRAKNE